MSIENVGCGTNMPNCECAINRESVMNKESLLRKISECEFMLCDLGLYLDTHPNCEKTLEIYHQHKKRYDSMCEEYCKHFGPLTNKEVNSTNYWTWVMSPWPWEKEGY